MLAFSKARHAGAASNVKKPSFGFLASSQIGQVGQSLLFAVVVVIWNLLLISFVLVWLIKIEMI